jgi:hypothetical protein
LCRERSGIGRFRVSSPIPSGAVRSSFSMNLQGLRVVPLSRPRHAVDVASRRWMQGDG